MCTNLDHSTETLAWLPGFPWVALGGGNGAQNSTIVEGQGGESHKTGLAASQLVRRPSAL